MFGPEALAMTGENRESIGKLEEVVARDELIQRFTPTTKPF